LNGFFRLLFPLASSRSPVAPSNVSSEDSTIFFLPSPLRPYGLGSLEHMSSSSLFFLFSSYFVTPPRRESSCCWWASGSEIRLFIVDFSSVAVLCFVFPSLRRHTVVVVRSLSLQVHDFRPSHPNTIGETLSPGDPPMECPVRTPKVSTPRSAGAIP